MVDPERFSLLFKSHAPALLLYARQWLDRAGADDLVQEIFVRLLAQTNEPANARAWLFTTARREALTQIRSASRRRKRETADTKPDWFEPAVSDSIDAEAAADAMKQLPVAQREAIVLRVWGQMTLSEAAEVLGVPTSTCFDLYRQGLAAIRQKLGEPCHK